MHIFLFHRDLRVEDNTALNALRRVSARVGLLFIFNEQQTNPQQPHFARNSFNYMLRRLAHLSQQFQLNVLQAPDEVSGLQMLLQHQPITAVYTNYDFTPFARDRDLQTARFCQAYNIHYRTFQDYLLFKPGTIVGNNNKLLRVFTPFWKRMVAKQHLVRPPDYLPHQPSRFVKIAGCVRMADLPWHPRPCPISHKRSDHLQRLAAMSLSYQQERDLLAVAGTSRASVAIKFGVVSVREVVAISCQRWGDFNNPFLRQLAWREFFYHTVVLAMQHHVWQWNHNWNSQFDRLPWRNNPGEFRKWCQGETGYQLVDAAMHQLNTTGEMHNRARLVVASFLTKNLLIDWRWGANYFKSQLIDYDPIVNMMSWQWVCGCGLDAAPYFRIFNPVRQQQRFDPENTYCQRFNSTNTPMMVGWTASRIRYLQIMQKLKQKPR